MWGFEHRVLCFLVKHLLLSYILNPYNLSFILIISSVSWTNMHQKLHWADKIVIFLEVYLSPTHYQTDQSI